MQFFPEVYTHKDHNGPPNGGPWPMYTNDRGRNVNGQSFNNFYIKPNADQIRVVYPNEVLKQTMLRQENIFREQVQDLHRLHRRQRELMYESRSGIKEPNIMPMSQNNFILSKASWDCASMTWQTPTNPTLPWINPATTNKLSTLGSKSPLSPFSFLDTSPQNESGFDSNELLAKKPKRKMLDLELPADDYVDSEEENVHEVQTSSSRCSMVKNINRIDLDLNLPPTLSLESEIENIAKYPNEGHFEAERKINLIDLNSCADEDEALPILPTISETMDLVPVSPENKESLPPRQEQEDTEPVDDLIRTAAETILMISKSSCYEKTVASVDESLYWFAGVVVSSMAHNLDRDEKEETKCVVALPSQQGKRHRKERRNKKISESIMSYGLGYGEKSLKSWGKVLKKRRVPRVPNSSIRLLWS